ncbi:hypothetical protein Vretifemale_17389, partial [Volvox reticuliferus]
MSAPHNDAVLDRVLTRIVSAGNPKANGRSPRGFSSVLQRDGVPARGNVGGDKRRSGSTTKFYANYRVTNPAFGSSSARDSSLAGTNTVVPQFVFAKGILRAPAASSAVQQSSTSINAANTAGSAATAAAAASTKATSTVILRQPPPQRSAASPQGHLRASRYSSPPLDISGAGALRRSSPGDARASAGGGISGGGGGGGAGLYAGSSSSPRHVMSGCSGAVGSPRAAVVSRNSSIPKERQLPGAGYGVRSSGGSSGDGAMGLLAAAYGGPTAAGPAVSGKEGVVSGTAPLPTRGRPGNTITRTAALRALKQQRSTTPDIIAELRAVSSLKATQQESSSQAASRVIAFPAVGDGGHVNPNAGGTATTTRQPQQQNQFQGGGFSQAGTASANADTAASSQLRNATQGGLVSRDYQSSIGAGTSSGAAQAAGGPRDASPHPPAHPPVPLPKEQEQLSNPPQKRAATQESQGHVQKQLKQQLQQQQQQLHPPQQLQHIAIIQLQQPKGQELPQSPAKAAVTGAGAGCVALGGGGLKASLEVGTDEGNGAADAAAPPQPTSASSTSACRDTVPAWDIGEEPSFRSPSPWRTSDQNGSGAPAAAAGNAVLPSTSVTVGAAAAVSSGGAQQAAAAVVAVAQRQQRAMRQHVQRQFSPSPSRRTSLVPGPLLTEKTGAALRASVSPLSHHRPRAMSLEVGNWQNDIVLAAQTRIRRLEEQVVSLSAHISELQASHADLEFQLQEEQQQGRAAAAAAAAAKRSGGGGNGKGGGVVPSQGAEPAEARPEEREKQLQEQVRQLQERLQAREAELDEQVTRARGANEALAKQNRALYGTLEETLSAAEHAAQELKQLRASHTQLQEAHEAAQKEVSQLKENLDLRERALSAVQAEFSSLRRRHEEVTATAEAARRDNALRDGRLRRELDVATQDAAVLAAQLTKLQREHQQLHSRKAEKDRQLAALAKRADAQQEHLVGAERLAQEQAALVRELESRATLLRNRNTALDRAVAAEKEARQAAQEQVRQMEEEIALLVSIVRQSDPNLEALARYKR